MYNDHTQSDLHPSQNRFAQSQSRLSANPRKAIQEMMETIDHLKGVYERETEALNKSDVKTFMALQDEKISTAQIYQDNIAQMMSRKEELKAMDPAARNKLEEMQGEFSQLAKKNMIALKKMQKTMDRFGGTLRDAARDAVKKDHSTNYTAKGRMDLDEAKRITTGTISETA